MSTINSIPFRSTIFYRTDGTVAPLGTVFTIGTNNTMSTTNSLSLDTLTASTMTSFSTITASTIRTAGANVAIGQNVSNPNRFVDIRSDIANSMYFDFHSSDSAVPDYSTRIQSLGGATTGTGALNMTASTIGLMASSGVGIGTTVPQAPLHVYNALGVSLSNTNVVNYTQSAILGFNFGGGVAVGTRDSFRILSQALNRDNGAGPTFFDYGAQADLIFQRKTNNLYSNGVNDKTYTEVMRLGGGTGFVGIGTNSATAALHIKNPTSAIRITGNLFNSSARPAVTAIPGACEIRGSGASDASDDGFLRLSAGGGSTVGTQAYIDLAGYNGTFADMNSNIIFGSAGTERMRIASNGFVGIGTNDPRVRLHVAGTPVTTVISSGYSYFAPNTGIASSPSGGAFDCVIYASGGLVSTTSIACVTFSSFSDIRIKKNIETYPSSVLDLLLQFRIVSYDHVDYKNGHVKAGLIAQEVEQIAPSCVKHKKEYIPNIYSIGTHHIDENNVIITIVDANGSSQDISGIEIGSSSIIFLKVLKNGTTEHDIYEKIISHTSTQFTVRKWNDYCADDTLFVYGTEVDDFRVLDKDVISMMGIKAIQELASQTISQAEMIQTHESTIASLQSQNAALQARMDALEALLTKSS